MNGRLEIRAILHAELVLDNLLVGVIGLGNRGPILLLGFLDGLDVPFGAGIDLLLRVVRFVGELLEVLDQRLIGLGPFVARDLGHVVALGLLGDAVFLAPGGDVFRRGVGRGLGPVFAGADLVHRRVTADGEIALGLVAAEQVHHGRAALLEHVVRDLALQLGERDIGQVLAPVARAFVLGPGWLGRHIAVLVLVGFVEEGGGTLRCWLRVRLRIGLRVRRCGTALLAAFVTETEIGERVKFQFTVIGHASMLPNSRLVSGGLPSWREPERLPERRPGYPSSRRAWPWRPPCGPCRP